jgi:hypothetical protein
MFLTQENTAVNGLDLDLSEILVSAEESWSHINKTAITGEATLAIAMASEATEEDKKGLGTRIWDTMKKYAKMVADWFKDLWAKISTFFVSVFNKLAAVIQSDEKTLAKLKAGEGSAKGSFEGKVYEGVTNPAMLTAGLAKISGAKPNINEGSLIEGLKKIFKAAPADGASKAIRTGLLGEEKEVKVAASDAGKWVGIYGTLVGANKELKKTSALLKSFAAYAANAQKILAGAISKEDEAGAKLAKAQVESAKADASAVASVVSATISAYNTGKGQARSVAVALVFGSGTAKADESGNFFLSQENAEESTLFNFA